MTRKEKNQNIRLAMRKVTYAFPDSPEGKFMCAIVSQAANDLLIKEFEHGAARYLENSNHAEMAGVNPVWVKEIFQRFNLI